MSPLLVRACLLILLGVAVTGCAGGNVAIDQPITGSGHVTTATRTVGGFTTVELRGAGRVRITQGGKESLRIEAEDNILPLIDSTVTGGTLVLRFHTKSELIHPTKPIIYDVALKEVRDLEVPGAGDISAPQVHTSDLQVGIGGAGQIVLDGLTATTLRTRLAGNGTIRATGQVTHQEVTIAGAGTYQGQDLASREADVSVPGAGTAIVRVRDRLHADIRGTGTIRYIGDPVVEQSITGVGTVTRQGEG